VSLALGLDPPRPSSGGCPVLSLLYLFSAPSWRASSLGFQTGETRCASARLGGGCVGWSVLVEGVGLRRGRSGAQGGCERGLRGACWGGYFCGWSKGEREREGGGEIGEEV
jgi:hypothetical protein